MLKHQSNKQLCVLLVFFLHFTLLLCCKLYFCVFNKVCILKKRDMHLQCTMRNVLVLSFPHALLDSHLYSPASFLLILVSSRMLPFERLPVLTAVQETDGTGLPVTLQVRFLFSPSITVMLLLSDCIADWTIQTKMTNKHSMVCERYNCILMLY